MDPTTRAHVPCRRAPAVLLAGRARAGVDSAIGVKPGGSARTRARTPLLERRPGGLRLRPRRARSCSNMPMRSPSASSWPAPSLLPQRNAAGRGCASEHCPRRSPGSCRPRSRDCATCIPTPGSHSTREPPSSCRRGSQPASWIWRSPTRTRGAARAGRPGSLVTTSCRNGSWSRSRPIIRLARQTEVRLADLRDEDWTAA